MPACVVFVRLERNREIPERYFLSRFPKLAGLQRAMGGNSL